MTGVNWAFLHPVMIRYHHLTINILLWYNQSMKKVWLVKHDKYVWSSDLIAWFYKWRLADAMLTGYLLSTSQPWLLASLYTAAVTVTKWGHWNNTHTLQLWSWRYQCFWVTSATALCVLLWASDISFRYTLIAFSRCREVWVISHLHSFFRANLLHHASTFSNTRSAGVVICTNNSVSYGSGHSQRWDKLN